MTSKRPAGLRVASSYFSARQRPSQRSATATILHLFTSDRTARIPSMFYKSVGDWLNPIEYIQDNVLIISVFVLSELATCSSCFVTSISFRFEGTKESTKSTLHCQVQCEKAIHVQGAHLHYLGSAKVYSLATDMTFMLHTSHTTFYTTQAAERNAHKSPQPWFASIRLTRSLPTLRSSLPTSERTENQHYFSTVLSCR
jgi:hypothetical protein